MIARNTALSYRWILWAVVGVILLAYPWALGTVFTNIFLKFAIFAVLAASLNMLVSYTGLLSFGHAMFFGVGAYATALTLENMPGMGLFPVILIGGLAGALLGFIISPMLNRVKATAFALLTLALGQLAYMASIKLRGITHGEDGVGGFNIPDFNIPGLLSVDMVPAQNFYYLALVILGICIFLMWFVSKTPFGSIMIGVRDNSERVDYLGINIPLTKCLIFTLSGFFAGIAGAMYALFENLVTPDGVLHIMTSFTPIMMVYVGGIGTFAGPIAGSGVMIVLEEIATRYTTQVLLFNGIILVLVVMFFRTGFVGLYETIKQKISSRKET